ncbi:hypothetical protein AYO21_11474 [Fonsecaea monophora]|uniref:Uncharacterized protein n=1 Tax=Fonsecaea monophora TaxID=254056 RepID=A0A177ERT1_9EURO|nr:hypothetical protein AYO21_11474 [Fonsecaea monophora]OAG34356.1 hypothetical protein AYO21_11474 [Fonsecaea monophora]
MTEPSSEDPKLELTDELRHEFRKLMEDEWAFLDKKHTGREKSPLTIAENSWPKSKYHLFIDWNWNPDEPHSTAFLRIKISAQFEASRLTPTDFCELIKSLDIWDPKQVSDLRTKTDWGCYHRRLGLYGRPWIPFLLFKYGRMYFYINAHPYISPGCTLVPRNIRKQKVIASMESRWVEYDPPIIIPPHLRSSEDTEYSSTLRYGLAIGKIAASLDDDVDDTDERRAREVPLDVLLHPADKSFWIVFQSFGYLPDFLQRYDSVEEQQPIRRTYRGTYLWKWTEADQPVAVWRMPFSDVQRIAQSRSYSGGYISKVNPEVGGDEKDSPRPQVIVDARDPVWNSWNLQRPIQYYAEEAGLEKYRDELLKSAVSAHDDSNDPPAVQPGPSDSMTN